MKSLLAPRSRPVLRALARGRVLLAFDFDGTLAPIVADPVRARLRPRTRGFWRMWHESIPAW